MSMRFNTPVFRPQDNKGRTLPGAQLFFYENYSTTPKTTYANVALTNPNPHPIIADGAGKFTDIFLGIGDYRVILTDRKGQILWDRNDVSTNDLTEDVINDIERQLDEVLNQYRMQYLGEYGVADPELEKTFTVPNAQYVEFNGFAYWTIPGTTLPYTTDSVTYPDPASDPNLTIAPNVTFAYVDTVTNLGDSQLAGGSIWPLSSQESAQDGQSIPAGTKKLRNATSGFLFDISPLESGALSLLDFDAGTASIGGNAVTLSGSFYETPTIETLTATNWPIGSTVKTKGFNSVGIGGATYTVKSGVTADGFVNHALPNGLTACFVGEYILTTQIGIDENSTTPSVALNTAQNEVNHLCVNTDINLEDRWILTANTDYSQVPGTTIKKVDAYDPALAAIRCNDDADQITFWFLNVDGNRANIPPTSENGHLFDIRGGSNITVIKGKCFNGTGDGFYVGAGVTNDSSRNINLNDCEGDNNRRQALSIVSVRGLRTPNFIGKNTNGIAPQAGIDIEPNSNDDQLFDIILENVYTENNSGVGIIIAPNLISGVNRKNIDIKIINHEDIGSLVGFISEKFDLTGDAAVQGDIKIIDPVYRDSVNSAITQRNYDTQAPEVQVIRPTIINPNTSGNSTPKYNSSIVCYREPGDTGAATIGNLRIVNPKFDYRNNQAYQNIYVRDETGATIERFKLINPTELRGTPSNTNVFTFRGLGVLQDEEDILSNEFGVSLTLSDTSYATSYRNVETAAIIITLPSGIPNGSPNMKFVKKGTSAQSAFLRVSPPAGGSIIGNPLITPNPTNGWEANEPESALILKPVGNNTWAVVSSSGDWQERP